jgi:hypothetical protein
MDYKDLKPRDVLEMYCYTSERTHEGTIYTIEDQRTNLTGKQILSKLVNGRDIYTWLS